LLLGPEAAGAWGGGAGRSALKLGPDVVPIGMTFIAGAIHASRSPAPIEAAEDIVISIDRRLCEDFY
jgi:hypothetical protein